MAEARSSTRIYSFGVFELDSRTGDLRRDGIEQPRLREQALRILLMLLDRQRDLVTRQELRELLWSSDTFVDFDHGLNTSINQLRTALGDSAGSPRFIQTIARQGYRFIAPVEIRNPDLRSGAVSKIAANDARQEPGQTAGPAAAERMSLLSEAEELPRVSIGIVRVLFSLVQVMYLSFYVISLARLSRVAEIVGEFRVGPMAVLIALVVTAACGIPVRLYLLSAAAFHYRGLSSKFQKMFPPILFLDGIWALVPFLIVRELGIGLALGATAALLYVPFAQRSLLLMGYSARQSIESRPTDLN